MDFVKKNYNINLFEIQRDNSNNNIAREIHINVENPEQSATFLCNCGLTIDIFLFNDLIPDCGFVADDEPILLSLLTKNKTFPCNLPFELPCKQGHPRCYNLTHVCNYQLHRNKYLMTCRNGAHLQRCQQFECNVKYKCQNSYCIPWSYVCDGKWDCPEGNDENFSLTCEPTERCVYMYKCRNTPNTCIHLANICDRHNECPYGDDEINCEFKGIQCPSSCQCLLFALYCNKMSDPHFKLIHLSLILSIHLCNSFFSSLRYLAPILIFPVVIKLPRNSLNRICKQLLSKQCLLLDLGFNFIQSLESNCFGFLQLLRSLSVNNNEIAFVDRNSFFNLNNLILLNLSSNPLSNLPDYFLINGINVLVLSMTNLSLTHININAFNKLHTKSIIASHYHVCCLFQSQIFCSAPQPWYVSCSGIFHNKYLMAFYILISFYQGLLNICSLLLQMYSKKTAFSVIAISLSITNLQYAGYLYVIWIEDVILQNSSIIQEEKWRSGLPCFIALGLIFCWCILTPLIMVFLSLSRFMVVVYPVDSRFKQVDFIFKIVISLFVCSLFVSILLTFQYKFTNALVTTNLCLPFVDPSGSVPVVKVFSWYLIVSQSTIPFIITVIYILLLIKYTESRKSVGKLHSKGNPEKFLKQQVVSSILLNFMSWIPMSAIILTIMFLPKYPLNLIAWANILIYPLNSMVNPVLFIFSSKSRRHVAKAKQQKS